MNQTLDELEQNLDTNFGTVGDLLEILDKTKSELHVRYALSYINEITKALKKIENEQYLPTLEIVDMGTVGGDRKVLHFSIDYSDLNGKLVGQDFYANNRAVTDVIKYINTLAVKYLNPKFISNIDDSQLDIKLTYDLDQNKAILLKALLSDEQNKELEAKILSFELTEKLSTTNKRNKI